MIKKLLFRGALLLGSKLGLTLLLVEEVGIMIVMNCVCVVLLLLVDCNNTSLLCEEVVLKQLVFRLERTS